MSTRWRGQPPRRLDAVHAGHADVHQHDVGVVRRGGGHRLLAGPRLGDDLDRAGRLEHGLEARAHHRLVVGDDDAQPAHAARRRRGARRGPRSRARRAGRRSACRRTAPRARACRPARGRRRSAAAAPSPRVGDRQLERVGPVAERHRRVRAAGVLDDVGQRLLHDPVGGQVDALRQRPRLALDGQVDADAGGARALEQLVELAEPGLRRERGGRRPRRRAAA